MLTNLQSCDFQRVGLFWVARKVEKMLSPGSKVPLEITRPTELGLGAHVSVMWWPMSKGNTYSMHQLSPILLILKMLNVLHPQYLDHF